MHTQKTNLSPSLHAITLVTCAYCTHMLTTWCIALGRLPAAHTVVQGTAHPLLLRYTAPHDSPHVNLALYLLCIYMYM